MNRTILSIAIAVVASMTAASAQLSIGPLRELAAAATSPSAQPQLAVGRDGRVVLSWLEDVGRGGARAFRYAYRDGNRWSAPVTITEREHLFVNWADVPSVFPLGDGRLAAHWLQYNGEGSYAYDVRLSISDREGRNWSRDAAPHRDGTMTEHGFVSFFEWPGGGTGVVWLDGREMGVGEHASHDGAHTAMTLRAARIAPDGTIGEDVRIDDRVCECCPTTAVATTRGAIVAYRDRSHEEVRDIGVIRLENGKWQAPALVHSDNWQIDACPVNGPALAASGDRVVLAWFTAEGDQPRTLAAFSSDAGKTWSKPIRVDEAKSLGRVDAVMLDDGRAVVMWMEHLDSGSELRARVIRSNGSREPHITVAATTADRNAGHARMVRAGNELIFAWVSSRPTMSIKTAVATVR
jgi:hypothetical protein